MNDKRLQRYICESFNWNVLDESLPKDDRLSDSGLPISLIFWFFFNLVEFKPKNKSYIFYL